MPEPELTPIQIKAAQLLAEGYTEQQVAEACGRSKGWVQNQKKLEIFQQALQEAKSRAKQVIQEYSEKAIIKDLEDFRSRFREAANLLYSASKIYLEKVKQRTEQLDLEELSPSRLGQALTSGGTSLHLALQIEQSALGIEELLEEVSGVLKISQEGVEQSK